MNGDTQNRSDGIDESGGTRFATAFRRRAPSRDRVLAVVLAVLMVGSVFSTAAAGAMAEADDGAVRTAPDVTAASGGADAASSTPGKCKEDNIHKLRKGDQLRLVGRLDSAKKSRQCGTTSVTLNGASGDVEVKLLTPPGADFDLYVTLDGRKPTPRDYDRKAAFNASKTPTVTVPAKAVSKNGRIGVAVNAYDGKGDFEVVINGGKKGGGGGGGSNSSIDARLRVGNKSPVVNQPVTLDATASNLANGSAKFSWMIDGSRLRTKSLLMDYGFKNPGKHTVAFVVKGPNGSTDIARETVNVRPGSGNNKTKARITVLSDSSIYRNETVEFSGAKSYSPGGVDRYVWQFGDGTRAMGESVEHKFSSAGNYTVTLVAIDEGVGRDVATRNVSVGVADVWIKDVEGALTKVVPNELFANCPDPVKVTVAGSERVEQVRFTYGRRTITDDFGANGWRTMKSKLVRGAGRSEVITITAVGANGSTDSETVRIRTAQAPGALGLITSGLTDIFRGGSQLLNKSPSLDLGMPPIVGHRCKLAVNYPQIAGKLTNLPNAKFGNIEMPDKVGRFLPKVIPFQFYAKFKMQYRPLMDEVSMGGGTSLQVNLNPVGETNVKGGGDVTGFFAMPSWSLSNFQMHAFLQANVYLEEYVSPVPIPSYNIKLPGGVKLSIDPIDVRLTPRLDVTGGINGDFELSSFAAAAKGSIELHGQLGDKCFGNVLGLGCLGGRAWLNGSLESNYIGIVPGNAKSFDKGGAPVQGKMSVGGGVQVKTPSALIPDVLVTWEKQFAVSTARVPASAASMTTAPAATGMSGGPVVTRDVQRVSGDSTTSSPAAALSEDRSDSADRPARPDDAFGHSLPSLEFNPA